MDGPLVLRAKGVRGRHVEDEGGVEFYSEAHSLSATSASPATAVRCVISWCAACSPTCTAAQLLCRLMPCNCSNLIGCPTWQPRRWQSHATTHQDAQRPPGQGGPHQKIQGVGGTVHCRSAVQTHPVRICVSGRHLGRLQMPECRRE